MSEPLLQLFGGEDGGRQSQLDRATRRTVSTGELAGIEITQGELNEGLSLAASTPVTVNHSLGRVPTSVLFCGPSEFARFRLTDSSTTSVTVESDAAVTVSLWIF